MDKDFWTDRVRVWAGFLLWSAQRALWERIRRMEYEDIHWGLGAQTLRCVGGGV